MATTITSFKQKCPTCQMLVPIRDAKLIGKKIDCPKCKFRFTVEEPGKTEDASASGNGDAEPQVEVLNDQEMQALINKVKPGKGTKAADPDKKKPRNPKLTMGLALAGVGLVVLATAGFFILNSGGSPKPPGNPGIKPGTDAVAKDGSGKKDKREENKDAGKKDWKDDEVFVPKGSLPVAGAAFTNLLLPDTTTVYNFNFRAIFSDKTIREALTFGKGPLDREEFQKRMGFSLMALDRMLRSTTPRGYFTALHFTEAVDAAALKKALNLEPTGAPILGQDYYKMAKPNPFFDQLARIVVGTPRQLQPHRQLFVRVHDAQTIIVADEKPLVAFLEVRGVFPYQEKGDSFEPKSDPNPKLPILPKIGLPKIGALQGDDDAGIVRFQQGGGKLPPLGKDKLPGKDALVKDVRDKKPPKDGTDSSPTDKTATDKSTDKSPTDKSTEKPPKEKQPDDKPFKPPTVLKTDTFRTINPALKELLDKLEQADTGVQVQVFFTSACTANVLSLKSLDASRGTDPRCIWDVLQLLEDRTPRLKYVASTFCQYNSGVFRMINEMACATEGDARELDRLLKEESATTVGLFVERMLNHPVELPPIEDPKKKDFPAHKKFDPKSRIVVQQDGKVVDFYLDLLLDTPTMALLQNIAINTAFALRMEIEAAGGDYGQHELARAGKLLGENGLPPRSVKPGQYPPGAFKRGDKTTRAAREPSQRISWMAGLLPYLGQERLFNRIKFDLSWNDPGNWLAGRTLVPEFIDPSYPSTSHYSRRPGFPFEAASTHYVGIAGVGYDAADYTPSDAAYAHKHGVLAYNKSVSLDEIRAGHGLANTILLIQVPHDGLSGMTPWIAGGGSTLRGVPETKSIAPFVLTTDKLGQPILRDGKRGTNVLMTDGSVRWVDESVSDDVFKAMATVKGPLPANFQSEWDEHVPLVPDPREKAKKPARPEEPPPPPEVLPEPELAPPPAPEVDTKKKKK